jgi:hypothetical protein
MADGVVVVQPDSSGKKIDTSELTVGANTVERQRMVLADPTNATSLAAVKAASTAPVATDCALVVAVSPNTPTLTVQGNQPAATTQAITTVSTGAPVAVSNLNVATITLNTFTGTTPSVTYSLQASADGGTTWATLQGINNGTGQVGTAWTQGAALPAGTAGPSCDYTLGGFTHIRVNVTAISGTSASAGFYLSLQAMPYESSPGAICQGVAASGAAVLGNPVLIAGSDGANAQTISVVAKNTQGAKGLATQDLKDSGRTYVTLSAQLLTGVTTEALATFTKNVIGTATTGQTAYTITSGKTFRIQSLFVRILNTTTVANNVTVNVRAAASVAATSPIVFSCGASAPAAVAGVIGVFNADIPDGMELQGNGTLQIGVSHLENVTTASIMSFTLVGYEY